MSDEQLPKLRPVNPRWLQFEGQRLLHIQDPLGLSDKTIIVPHSVAPLLGLLDGARNLDEVRAAFLLRSSAYLTPTQIEALIDNLDQALLLDNRRFRNALQEAVDAYRSGPFRKPAFAGGAYEEDPDALLEALDGYCDTAKSEAQADPGALVGLISPHVDYPRGWRTYADTWSRARKAVEEADLVILFGTDHGGAPNSLTLTRQSYATPWGTLPTDVQLVDRLAPLLGEEQAFAQEVHHINEHSIELAAVWLHYIAGRQPKPLLPVLCGPPGRKPSDVEVETQDDAHDGVSGPPQDFLEALADIAAGPRVLVVAAADLSHVGPAFGDPAPLDSQAQAGIHDSDQEWLQVACSGNDQTLADHFRQHGDPTRICGAGPIYYMLSVLPEAQGHVVSYQQCPADEHSGSLVSVAGVLFTA